MRIRPRSIVWFDVVFWLVIGLGVVQTALQWNAMLVDTRFAPLIRQVGMMPIYAIVVVLVASLVALWYFIARRGSVIAKWLFVLLTLYTLYDGVTGLFAGGWPTTLLALLTYLLLVLQVVAVALLFMPDTRAWFGESEDEAEA